MYIFIHCRKNILIIFTIHQIKGIYYEKSKKDQQK